LDATEYLPSPLFILGLGNQILGAKSVNLCHSILGAPENLRWLSQLRWLATRGEIPHESDYDAYRDGKHDSQALEGKTRGTDGVHALATAQRSETCAGVGDGFLFDDTSLCVKDAHGMLAVTEVDSNGDGGFSG